MKDLFLILLKHSDIMLMLILLKVFLQVLLMRLEEGKITLNLRNYYILRAKDQINLIRTFLKVNSALTVSCPVYN